MMTSNNTINQFRKFSYKVQVIFSVFLLSLLVIIYQLITVQNNIKLAQSNANYSINLAYELFQTSEDLTRMARSYVSTGDIAYKKAFNTILEIRNGEIPRPSNYSPVYWHLNLHNRSTLAINESPTRLALRKLMIEAKFTTTEMALLDRAKTDSEGLALIEKDAFRIVEELPARGDNATGFLHSDAIAMLYDQDFLEKKESIMKSINTVVGSVEQRFADEIDEYQKQMRRYIDLMWGLIITALIGVVFVYFYTSKKFVLPLTLLSQTDTLTKLLNCRGFLEIAKEEFKRSRRTTRPFSLMMIDIDYFKQVNDNYGHDQGDKVLVVLSELLQKELRDIDIICRWGGEEFVILLMEADHELAFYTAERVRKLVSEKEIQLDKNVDIQITISVGLSTYQKDTSDLSVLIRAADEALYTSKNTGRNKVSRSEV